MPSETFQTASSNHRTHTAMPACFCPHCKTRLWVKETQLNVAQGFVVCHKCEGLFKAKDHLAPTNEPVFNDLPEAVSDVKLVHRIGAHALHAKQISRGEIAVLLQGGTPAPAPTPAADAPNSRFNWTLASMIALIILIMQLFYLTLL